MRTANPSDGNMHALREYELAQDRLPELRDGEDVCHGCGGIFEESDLWRAGGDGEPTCSRCIRNDDSEWKRLRALAREAAAVLDTPDKSPYARSLATRIFNLLDG